MLIMEMWSVYIFKGIEGVKYCKKILWKLHIWPEYWAKRIVCVKKLIVSIIKAYYKVILKIEATVTIILKSWNAYYLLWILHYYNLICLYLIFQHKPFKFQCTYPSMCDLILKSMFFQFLDFLPEIKFFVSFQNKRKSEGSNKENRVNAEEF